MAGKREETSEQVAGGGVGSSLNIKGGGGGFRGGGGAAARMSARITVFATILNPNAGLGLQRSSARRQPVVQTQVLGVQTCSVGVLQRKRRTTGEKALAYRGKGGQNTAIACPALIRVKGGSLPSKRRGGGRGRNSSKLRIKF